MNAIEKLIRKRVAAGIALLDKAMPTWHTKIDLAELRLASCEACICGQLARHTRSVYVKNEKYHTNPFQAFANYLSIRFFGSPETIRYTDSDWDAAHGFATPWNAEYNYDELDAEWRRVIINRLRRDARAAAA